jgi:hypothetical protein
MKVEEVSLSAYQKKSEMRKELQWHIEGGGGAAAAADDSPKTTPRRDPLIKNCSRGDPMISTNIQLYLHLSRSKHS